MYSGVLTSSIYILQFITYPYVARVLGVSNIGICNFVQSIVNYFLLFSMLGINTLGVREIAKCNGDQEKLNQTFSRLFTLNAISTLVVLLVYLVSIELIPQFTVYRKLLYIGAVQILFNLFTVEWLFRGLENFRYVTLRTMVIRVCYVLAIFLLVKESDDYSVYFIISVAMVVANGIVNWLYRRKLVRFRLPSFSSIKLYFRPFLFLGSQVILTSMYTTFNVAYLGFVSNDTEVGYYTTATKIEQIIMVLYSSFTVVMMPRVSALIEQSKQEEVNRLIIKSLKLLCAFAVPIIIFSEIFAEEIVFLVGGIGYEGAVMPMRIVMPLLLIIGIEQILIVQLLVPARADKEVFLNSVIGAGVGIALNILLVPHWQSVGSAVVWSVAELSVLLCAYYFIRKRFRQIKISGVLTSYIMYFIPLILILGFKYVFAFSWLVNLLIAGVLTVLYSHIVLYYFIKDEVYRSSIKLLLKHMHIRG